MKWAVVISVLLWPSVALAYGPRGGTVCVPGAATGTVYYFCDCGTGAQPGCTVGNDANAGTSAASPKRTLDAARSKFSTMNDGDRVELCQGGVFTATPGSHEWSNGNFTVAGGGGTLMSYAASWGGAGVKPKFKPTDTEPGIQLTRVSTPAYGPYTIADIEIAGSSTSSSSGQNFGVFVFGNNQNVTVCNVDIHDMGIGISTARNVETDRNTNVTLRDSVIHDNWAQGWLGGDTGSQILYNHFENNGFSTAVLDHNIYFVGANGTDPTQPSIGILIQGNELYKACIIGGQCQAASLTAHGLLQDLTIDGNWVHEDAGAVASDCWGIAPAPGYPGQFESLKNVTVSNNLIENVGNVSIAVGSWVGGRIFNNAINNRQAINDKAISIPENEFAEDAKTTGVLVYNNSINIDMWTAIAIGTEGTGYAVWNNAIYHTGGGTPSCFLLPLATSAYGGGVDNNLCFIVGGTGNHWQNTQSLAAWQGTSGFDTHSLTTNPNFLALTSPFNLAFLNTSPLYNAGNTANGAGTDILGVTRPQGSATDIGAYELPVSSLPSLPGGHRPASYGVWICALIFVGLGIAAARRAGARRIEATEPAQHLIDEHTTAALEEMKQDGIGLPVNEHCEDCVKALFLSRETNGKRRT